MQTSRAAPFLTRLAEKSLAKDAIRARQAPLAGLNGRISLKASHRIDPSAAASPSAAARLAADMTLGRRKSFEHAPGRQGGGGDEADDQPDEHRADFVVRRAAGRRL